MLQATPHGADVSYDRWRYLEAQTAFATYLEALPVERIPLELAAWLVDPVTGARELIGSKVLVGSRTQFINPTQVAFGAIALLASGGWGGAPGILWATVVSLSLGVFLATAMPGVPVRRRLLFAGLVVLAPAGIWFRTVNTKEPLLLAATALLAALTIRCVAGRPKARTLALLLLLLALIFVCRAPYAMILASLLLTGLLVSRRRNMRIWLVSLAIAAAIVAIARFPQLIGRTTHEGIRVLPVEQMATFYITQMMETRAEYGAEAPGGGGSAVMKSALVGGPAGLIHAPAFVAYYLLGPFPWQSGTGLMNLGKIQALVYWPVTVLFLMNVFAWRRLTPQHRMFVWVAGGLVVVLAILEANLGTIMRHRTTWEPLLFYAATCGPLSYSAARSQSEHEAEATTAESVQSTGTDAG